MFYPSNNKRGTGVEPLTRRTRLFVATTTCTAIVTLCSGCLMPKKAPTSELLAPTKTSIAEKAIDALPQDTAKDSSLAAIEDFLQRTSQYRATEQAATANIPASPVLFPNKVEQESSTAKPAPTTTPPVEKVATNAEIAINAAPQTQRAMAIPAIMAVSIGSEEKSNTEAVVPPQTNTTNQAMDVHAGHMRPTFDDLLADLSEHAAEKADFVAEWRLRLAQLAAGRDKDAMETAKKLPEQQARLLTDMIDAVLAVRDAARNPLLSGETALATVDDLRDTLADRADPSVQSIAFCRKVSTFGVFEKMSRKDFVAGRKIQTIVYSEIRNLRAQRTTDDRFETRLSTRMAIYSDSGEIVWQRDEPEIVDLCSKRRTDFFIAQRIALPATLPAGPYVLKVLVEDKLGGRASESTHDFEIFAPVAIAQGE
jgi:hypothetical protein